jgi:phosphate transport system permease protein
MNIKFTKSQLFYAISWFSCVLVIFIFLGVLLSLLKGSWLAIKTFGFQFLWNDCWNPVKQMFGALGVLKGTVITSLIALVFAVPLSFALTIFTLRILPKSLRNSFRIAIDLLAGIPSIIYGMWGLFFLVPIIGTYIQPCLAHLFPHHGFFAGPPLGIGLFSAGIVLGLMIIPFITSIMQDVIELVPPLYWESVFALGATTWEAIRYIIIPFGRTGLIGGIMLGLGRALGETMAVAFIVGNAHTITHSLFVPASTITSTLANEFNEASNPLYSSVLVELGLNLFILTGFIVLISNQLLKVAKKKIRKKR